MPLTHVCMWSGHGWKRVTAYDAAKMFPYGISAYSGLFMCDICGQYVTLTNGGIRDPYFKHSSEEKSKDCPERTFANGTYATTFNEQIHSLPIKLTLRSGRSFEIALGFFSLPSDLIGKKDKHTIIIQGGNSSQKFQYSLERLNPNGITYLSVGEMPYETYKISCSFDTQKVQSYWPSIIQGISADGTLFDKETGKKLPEDADVSVGHTYYLITKRGYILDKPYISQKRVCTSSNGYFNAWYVYEIQASKYDESSARFFLELHARLTDHPVKLFPIWPEFIEYPYRVMHRKDVLYFYLEGEEVTSKAFPYAYIQKSDLSSEDTHILRIESNDRQQLVSAGRVKVLKYTYLWKDSLLRPVGRKELCVVDDTGQQLSPGTYQHSPSNGQISFSCEIDGFVEVNDIDGFPINRYSFSAGQKTIVDNVRIGTTVNIYYGLDLVWSAKFEQSTSDSEIDERNLIKQLETYQYDYIRISHAAGSLAAELQRYPMLRNWYRLQVKNGKISKRALQIIKLVGERHDR